MSDESVVMDDVSVDSDVGSAPETGDTSVASTPETTTAQAPAAAAPPQQSVWDAFKRLPDFKGEDDVAIARRLYASMEREKAATSALAQYQQYIPYAQQYLQNKPEFEAWRAAQQQQQQPAPQQPQQPTSAAEAMKRWWNPPEVRESYKQYLVKDEHGRDAIAEHAPLEAKNALYEYQKYKADFAQKFLTNPEDALGPMIQDIAKQQAQQIVQAQFEEVQQQQFVTGLEQENKDWLYDESGQPTEEGLAAREYIDRAASMGIQSPKERWEVASAFIERDLQRKLLDIYKQNEQRGAFEAGLPQQNAPTMPAAVPAPQQPDAATQAQKDIEFLRREASRNPSRATGAGDNRAPQAPMTFEQVMSRQLARDNLS